MKGFTLVEMMLALFIFGLVSAAGVGAPAAVRFEWTNTPTGFLVNSAGLPAAPFRTDNWE